MTSRLFPICPEFFACVVEPLIYAHYKRPGRPPEGGHYRFFCAVLYVLRTGISWRDLPPALERGILFIHGLSAGVKMAFFGLCCISCSREKR